MAVNSILAISVVCSSNPSPHPAHLLYHILDGDDAHWLLLICGRRLTRKAGLEGGEGRGARRAQPLEVGALA